MTTDPRTVESYEEVRQPEYGSLGDGYRMCAQDPAAFAAGAQYALDRLNNPSNGPMETVRTISPELAKYLDAWSAEILARALDGEPQ